MPNACFITDKEVPTVEFLFNNNVYHISEELSDEHSVKVIKQMITDKIESSKNQKKELLFKIEDMAKSMGVSKEELIKILGGNVPNQDDNIKTIDQVQKDVKQEVQKPTNKQEDDGFKPVDGGLKSSSRASLSIEEGTGDHITPAVPAYSTVKSGDKVITETNKKVKTVDNVMFSKSDMGTTAIAIAPTDSGNVNKVISAVNRQTHALIRPNASGNENQAKECPVCRGSGITIINKKVCTKCNGSGFIFV